jgi:hypothetical protein
VGQAGSAQRLPLSEFVANPQLLAALRSGVSVMRARDPSDPTSWFFQAAVHAVTDGAVAEALAKDPNVAQVDQDRFWNKCPHSRENSANFLIWHRAYVYYFERILRDAAGMPDLALPYWDYSTSNRLFPAAFAPEFLDRQQTQPNSLYHANRELAFVFQRYELTDRALDISRPMQSTVFFGEDESSGFAGGIADLDPDTKGLLEGGIHDEIHFAVGGVIGAVAGAMSNVPTAAFDPIFWVHHSNIDRLWAEWTCRTGKTWGVLPPQAWLDEVPWSFYDFNKSIKSEARRFYFDHHTLGYRYRDEPANCLPLELPQVVASGAPESAGRLNSLSNITGTHEDEIADEIVDLKIGAGEEAKQSVALKGLPESTSRGSRDLLAPTSSRSSRRVLLELGDIGYEGVPSSGYEIYVNAPDNEPRDRSSPHFVGTIALFGLQHRHAGGEETWQRFDITKALGKGEPKAIKVDVVAFDRLKSEGGEPLRRPDPLHIGRMRVLVVEKGAAEE